MDATLLWCPARANMETSAAWADWKNGQLFEWPGLGLAKWAVPAPGAINWLANPYPTNTTWYMYHHGLVWLLGISWGLLNDSANAPAATFKPLMLAYIRSWIDNNAQATNPQAWTEETIPRRLAVISYIWHRHLAGTAYVTAADETAITAAVDTHLSALSPLIDDPAFAANNHGMMHALGAYSGAKAFPAAPGAAAILPRARADMIATAQAMFHDSGVCREGARGYHDVDLAMIREGSTLCANFADAWTEPAIATLMTGAVLYAALATWPNGAIPACGDTSINSVASTALTNGLRGEGYDSPAAAYAMTKGASGTRPAPLYVWPDAGYAVMRPAYSADWASDTMLHIGCWLAKFAHGHKHPGGHFLLYSHGRTLIEDSGGPMIYGNNALQRYFIEPEGHNQLIVQGAVFDAGVSASVVSSGCTDSASWLTLSHTAFAGATVERTIVLDHATRAVVVIDTATCNTARDMDVLWHLPADAVLADDGARKIGAVGASAVVGIDVADLSASVIQGLDDASGYPLQGWVTPSYNVRQPAPVCSYRVSGTSARIVSVLQPAASAADLRPVRITKTATDVIVSIGPRKILCARNGAAAFYTEPQMPKFRRTAADQRVVEDFLNPALFTFTYQGAVAAEPTLTKTAGALKLTVNAGAVSSYTEHSSLATGINMSEGGQLALLCYVPDEPGATAAVRVAASNQAMGTGHAYFNSTALRKGWNVLKRRTGPGAGWTGSGTGVTDWGNLKYWRWYAQNMGGQVLIFDQAVYGGFHRGSVVIGLDGGTTSQSTLGAQVLIGAGVSGYIATAPENVGQSGYSSAATLTALASSGIEVLGAVGTDAAAAKAFADTNGGSGVVWVSAPTDAQIAAVGAARWGCYRGTGENHMSGWGNINPLRHHSYSLGGVTLATAKARVDKAWADGELLILSVPATLVTGGTGAAAPADTTQWYIEDLTALARYIADGVAQGRGDNQTPAAWLKSVA